MMQIVNSYDSASIYVIIYVYMICVEQRNDENQEAILQVNIESIIVL